MGFRIEVSEKLNKKIKKMDKIFKKCYILILSEI